MIDIKLIRKDKEFVKKQINNKGVDVDIDRILELDKARREIINDIDNLRHNLRKESDKMANLKQEEKEQKREELKKLSNEIKEKEKLREVIEEELNKLLYQIPNLPQKDVPVGKDENDNVVIRYYGKIPVFNFEVKDHVELGEKLDIIDIKRAVKICGSRFYYLKREAALLEFALISFVSELLTAEGFIPIIPPVLAKEEIFIGMGYLPSAEYDMYKITLDNLRLAATSEQTIGAMYKDEIIPEDELPLRFLGFSSCFRREAGAWGRDVRGILRVHQFDKLEMVSFCKPEDSSQEHEYLVSLEEKVMQKLNIPYRVVMMCSGDLGMPTAKKYDIEAWIPSQKVYRETHSCSNCTDFQARRLNIRLKRKTGKIEFLHILNGTACAIGRTLIAILENYQKEDGTIEVPEVLKKYVNFEYITRDRSNWGLR